MKVTYEAYGKKVEISLDHDDVNMEELFDCLRELVLAAGFASKTVGEYFDPYTEEDEFLKE